LLTVPKEPPAARSVNASPIAPIDVILDDLLGSSDPLILV
jgi:hypothetical protein